jgi:hypothetical protein
MSAELPQLERLIADAAERHYGGRRRRRMPAPRLSLVAGLVAAAAVVVLAIAILPLRSDEQAARPPVDPATVLAERYSVFAGSHTPSRLEAAALSDKQDDVLDARKPATTRQLRRLPGGGFVVVAGTTKWGAATICFWERDTSGGRSGCQNLSDLPATAPGFVFGAFDDDVIALVPDVVTSVRMQLRDGTTRPVPVKDNLAYLHAGQRVCRISWTTAGGDTGADRSLMAGC